MIRILALYKSNENRKTKILFLIQKHNTMYCMKLLYRLEIINSVITFIVTLHVHKISIKRFLFILTQPTKIFSFFSTIFVKYFILQLLLSSKGFSVYMIFDDKIVDSFDEYSLNTTLSTKL